MYRTLADSVFIAISRIGFGSLLLGAIPLAIGSILLVTKVISLEQSFKPPFNGYWLIGIWIVFASLPAVRSQFLSPGLGWLGIVIGIAWITFGLTMWIGGTQAQYSMPMVVGGSVGMLGFIVWTFLLGLYFLRASSG